MHHFKSKVPFPLEVGETLAELETSYFTYGTLNAERNNVVWICHALTANADAADWWSGLVGEGKVLNPHDYFIVCANNLGSCYGATNPDSINPKTDNTYGKDFPLVTIRDMTKAHDLLRKHLNIEEIHLLIGGSMGGQQVLEWAILEPTVIRNVCVLATNAQHSAWGIAFNEAQRMALEADPTLYDNTENAGANGLEAARAVAMLSYRNHMTYNATQTEKSDENISDFLASSYQKYQGEKLRKRFSALSYLALSKSMDSQNIGRGRGGVINALELIKAPTLVIGIASDILFPPEEQRLIAKHIPTSDLEIIESNYGHDGFLIEFEKIGDLVRNFLNGDLRPGKEQLALKLPGTEQF